MKILDELDRLGKAVSEGANAYFEYDASLFYERTGHLAPGKDDALRPLITDQERRDLWMAFLDRRKKDNGNAIRALVRVARAAEEVLNSNFGDIRDAERWEALSAALDALRSLGDDA